MTQGVPIPRTEAVEDVGPLGLGVLADVIASPGRAFARLARQPRWLGPYLVALLCVGAASWIALPVNLEYTAGMVETALDRAGASEADRAVALANLPDPDDRSAGVLLAQVGGGTLFAAVLGLVGALALHLIARVAGRLPTLRQSLALFAAAFVVMGIGSLVKSVLVRSLGSVEVTLGPGALVPDLPFHSIRWILLDLLDVFSLWSLALLTLGGAIVWGVRRGTALGICGTYWFLQTFVIAGARIVISWSLGAL